MNKFKVGDVVVVTHASWIAMTEGMCGRVAVVRDSGRYGIDFGPHHPTLHDLGGEIHTPTGFFLTEAELDFAKEHYITKFIHEALT